VPYIITQNAEYRRPVHQTQKTGAAFREGKGKRGRTAQTGKISRQPIKKTTKKQNKNSKKRGPENVCCKGLRHFVLFNLVNFCAQNYKKRLAISTYMAL